MKPGEKEFQDKQFDARLEQPGMMDFLRTYKRFVGREVEADEVKFLFSVIVTFDKLAAGF